MEIIGHYDTKEKAGLVFVADFKKAFDKVNWEFTNRC